MVKPYYLFYFFHPFKPAIPMIITTGLVLLPALMIPLRSYSGDKNGTWQLFIDDDCVESRCDVSRRLHQPEKFAGNPVLKGDVPWAVAPYLYGTVLYDDNESLYKMWYMSYNYGMALADRTPFLYATSRDGVQWYFPHLGLYEFQGSKANNIILTGYGHHDQYCPSVLFDRNETDPNRLYKMVYWDYPHGDETYGDAGMCLAFSPDGIHWTRYEGNPVQHAMKKERSISDVLDLMVDPLTNSYVVYSKGWADPWPLYRQIVRTESTDFNYWSEPEVVLRHAFDESDPQSYGMPVFRYESVYLGLLRSYKKPGDETIDIQLTISHDNHAWSRVADEATFIPLGPEGSWDCGMIFTAPPVIHDDQIEIYYGGWDGPHNASGRHGAIGLATLRKDGFVSLDAGDQPGMVLTKCLTNLHDSLLVNVDIHDGGWFKAEILNERGDVIPGYRKDECHALRSGGLAEPITWRENARLPKDGPIKIQFIYSHADLYSFYGGEVIRDQNK